MPTYAPFLLAVTGGSGSGKSTIAHALARRFPGRSVVVADDHYYLDNGGRPGVDPAEVDFDAPSSKDLGLLAHHLRALKAGEAVERPNYCFATHRRLAQPTPLPPADVTIVEGIHVLADAELAGLFDLAVYVDAPELMRFVRRLLRDVGERQRTAESVVAQFLGTVRPAHDRHIEPARAHAHVVVANAEQDAPDDAVEGLIAPILTEIYARRPDLVSPPTSSA